MVTGADLGLSLFRGGLVPVRWAVLELFWQLGDDECTLTRRLIHRAGHRSGNAATFTASSRTIRHFDRPTNDAGQPISSDEIYGSLTFTLDEMRKLRSAAEKQHAAVDSLLVAASRVNAQSASSCSALYLAAEVGVRFRLV